MEAADQHKTKRLRWGAIGLFSAATLGVVFMSPGASFYGNWGPVAGTVGTAATFVFIIAFVVMAPTALSYAFVATKLPTAGAAYSWVGILYGKHIGNWHGWIMSTFYILILFAPTALFGLFFNSLLNTLGVDVSLTNYWTYALGVLIVYSVAGVLGYLGVKEAVRASAVIVTIEIVVILALATTIMFQHLGSLSFKPFLPSSTVFSASNIWVVLPLAFFSFTGFDVVSTAAEETRSPRHAIPRATILAVSVYFIFFIWAVYGFTTAVSPATLTQDINSGITPVIPIAKQYWGGAGVLITLTGLSASLGATIALIVGTGRILFAMGREGALPARFGRVHPRFQTPWMATTCLIVVGLAYDLIVGAWIGPLFAYFWTGTAIAFFALITYGLVNVAVFLLYRRKPDFNIWLHVVIPVLGVVFSAVMLYESFFLSLWNAGWVTIGRGIVVFAVGWALIGVVYAFLIRNRTTTPRIEPVDDIIESVRGPFAELPAK
jgi:APA family basic amino acid/polyamine antiporter